jgi:hypothetical protein
MAEREVDGVRIVRRHGNASDRRRDSDSVRASVKEFEDDELPVLGAREAEGQAIDRRAYWTLDPESSST